MLTPNYNYFKVLVKFNDIETYNLTFNDLYILTRNKTYKH